MIVRTQIVLILSALLLFGCFNNSEKKEEPVPTCGVKCGNELKIKEPDIFKAKCATCHMLDKDITGPKLRNILNEVPSELWFDQFVRNEDSLTQVQDAHTLKIQKWSPVDGNHNFKEITKGQLQQLKDFFSQN